MIRTLILVCLFACATDDEAETIEELRAPANAQFSDLWGRHGRDWTPRSRLPDFSYAGYAGGEADPPRFSTIVDVRDHGARPDDNDDDTNAIQRAIDAAPRDAVIVFHAGRYRISSPIEIRRGHLALRGEGSGDGGTTLFVTRPLKQAVGIPPGHDSTYFSHSGGFFSIDSRGDDQPLAQITRGANRGDRTLTVDSTAGISPGDILVLRLAVDRDLLSHVYADQFQLSGSCLSDTLDLPVVVESVTAREVKLVQPLRLDIRNGWNPKLVRQPYIEDFGIERVRIEFAHEPYAGHHLEPGFNAISMKHVANGWVRNVSIVDADNGFLVEHSKWLTFENIEFHGRAGHHGFTLSKSADILVQEVRFHPEMWHELTVVYGAHGNVFRRINSEAGNVINLDHHGAYPFENLFTNFGPGRYSWLSGGGDPCKGPHSGARGTFWNLPDLAAPNRYDDADGDREGELENLPWRTIQTTVVGKLGAGSAKNRTNHGLWTEDLPRIWPPDLYRAQYLERRAR